MGNTQTVNYDPVKPLGPSGQYGSLYRRRPEFSDRRIDSKIGLAPASFRVRQLWLPVGAMAIDKLFDTNSNSADPGPPKIQALVELQRLGVDLIGDVGRCWHGGGAGQLSEITRTAPRS